MIEENLFIFLKRNWRLWQNSLIIVVEFLLLNWQKIVTVWFRWIHKFKKYMNINFYGYDFEIYTLCFFNVSLKYFICTANVEVCIHKIIFWEVIYFLVKKNVMKFCNFQTVKNYIVWPVFCGIVMGGSDCDIPESRYLTAWVGYPNIGYPFLHYFKSHKHDNKSLLF